MDKKCAFHKILMVSITVLLSLWNLKFERIKLKLPTLKFRLENTISIKMDFRNFFEIFFIRFQYLMPI